MMNSLNIRREILFIIVPVVIIAIAWVLNSQPTPEASSAESGPECYEERTPTMTIQQVANLLDVSLVELTWLPDNVESVPELRTNAFYSGCNITLRYPEAGSSPPHWLITVGVEPMGFIALTKTPTLCSWQFTPTESLNTSCGLEIDSPDESLRIRIYLGPSFTPEDSLRVLESVRIIEPTG